MPRETTDSPAQVVAARLLAAYESGKPCEPVRDLLSDQGAHGAYLAQTLNTQHWVSKGRKLVGRKIGLTSRAVQQQLGVNEPDYGMLFADMCLGDGEEIPANAVIQPRVEAEVALVLERDLAAEQLTLIDVLRAVAFAAPSIEIVGSRIARWDIKITDTIADNASSGAFVIGGPTRSLMGLDLVQCQMTMRKDGSEVSKGTGAACLGNPLNAALWLARKMVEVGSPLRAGDVVMTGALGPMVPAQPGDSFVAEISGLGSVRATFTPS
jgi:2-keto-4-pentenoate hydratase